MLTGSSKSFRENQSQQNKVPKKKKNNTFPMPKNVKMTNLRLVAYSNKNKRKL